MKLILKKITFLLLCLSLASHAPLTAAGREKDTNGEAAMYTFASNCAVFGALTTGFANYAARCMGPWGSKDSAMAPAICSAAGLICACFGYSRADAKTETGNILKKANIVLGGVSLALGAISLSTF